jgi:hypothetical protein
MDQAMLKTQVSASIGRSKFLQVIEKLCLQAAQKDLRGEARVVRIWLIAYGI